MDWATGKKLETGPFQPCTHHTHPTLVSPSSAMLGVFGYHRTVPPSPVGLWVGGGSKTCLSPQASGRKES